MPIAGQCWVSCQNLHYDAAGAALLPYQLLNGPTCPNSVPVAGQLPIALRFRGFACGPGPLASVSVVGSQCGNSAGGTPAYLGSVTPPVLGQPWVATLTGPYFETAFLFWSVGINAIGTTIPGSSCQHFLDSQSVQTLAVAGLEPLGSTTLTLPINVTVAYAIATFTLPALPSLAGVVLGAQAVVSGPTGTIPLGPGTSGQLSNALQLTLGY
jgi:hypothetical protein